jgi:membrane-bound serine protease (ClpP class)
MAHSVLDPARVTRGEPVRWIVGRSMMVTGTYPHPVRILRLGVIALLAAATLLSGVAAAQELPDAVVVVEVGDPLDQRTIDYVTNVLESEPAHLFILKIDSPGVSSGDLTDLFDAVAAAPAPVVSWIGPSPAVAYGGAAYLANQADVRSAAPGAVVGYLDPAVHRGDDVPPSTRPAPLSDEAFAEVVSSLATETVTTSIGAGGSAALVPGFVDQADPALGQLLIGLDGREDVRGDVTFVIDTATTETIDGQEVIVQSRPVQFTKTGLLDRFLRLGARPETAFLFLLFGLAFAVFEFYAAGTGLMASIASIALVVGGYGLATLPMWWPSLLFLVGGVGLLVWAFGQNRVDWRAPLGTVSLLVSGFTFTTTYPQYPPAWWMVLLAVAAAVTFIWYSLTTVVRGRFATPTVGREDLVGSRCLVVDTLDPLGVVVVAGARWQATADRGVEIRAGAAAEVVGVTGLLLEVDPVGPEPDGKNREVSA